MSVYGGPEVVNGGLVLCLDAANPKSYPGSGTAWTDMSGLGNNGTLVNGPTFDANNAGGIVFDGVNDYMTTTVLPSGTDLFTLSFWIYLNTNLTGNWGGSNKSAIIFTGDNAGTYEFILLTIDGNVGPPYTIALSKYGQAKTGLCQISQTNIMPIQRWHNLVLIRDGAASQQIYLNGSLLTTGNISDSMASAATMLSGGATQSGYSGYLNGKFSNILKYNRALSASEIQQNFNALRGRYGI